MRLRYGGSQYRVQPSPAWPWVPRPGSTLRGWGQRSGSPARVQPPPKPGGGCAPARAGGAEACWERGCVMNPESRRGEASSLAVKCAQPLNKKHFILFSNCIISA